MAKGTRDEAYHWISDRKEKTMNRKIRDRSQRPQESLQRELSHRQLQITEAEHPEKEEKEADEPEGMPAKIFVDSREREMAKLLESLGLEITVKNLEVGDYVVSDRVAIQRKTPKTLLPLLSIDRETCSGR